MGKTSFLKSRGVGQNGERVVKKILEQCGFYCEVVSGKNPDYDLVCKLDDLIFFVEVKNDIKAQFTGNFAIELYNSKLGELSGLSITKADIWAHIVGQNIYLISVVNLKRFTKENQPEKVVEGGDNNSIIYLYKANMLDDPSFFLHHQDNLHRTKEFLLCELR